MKQIIRASLSLTMLAFGIASFGQYSTHTSNFTPYTTPNTNTQTYSNSNGNGGGPGTGNGATNIHEPKNPNGDGKYHDKYDNGIGNSHQDEGIGPVKKEPCPLDGGTVMALMAAAAFGIKKAGERKNTPAVA